jgi:type I restriction enzyme M protein
MANHHELTNFIWQIADLLRGPYRPPQYERVMLPFVVLRRFDCVLAKTKDKVVAEYDKLKGGKVAGDALDPRLNKIAGPKFRFHNHSPLTLEKLKGDPEHIDEHLVYYIKGFSANVRRIFDYFEIDAEIQKMHEANILYLVVSKFCDVDLYSIENEDMGRIFEHLIRKFNELANETAGDHFTPREVIHLMVDLLFIDDDGILSQPNVVRKLLDPACGTGGMLAQALNYIEEHDQAAELWVFGQDYNKRAYAVAASDLLLKGRDNSEIAFGDSFTDDQFGSDHRTTQGRFDYLLSNPPFGVDWKKQQMEIVGEHEQLGFAGRFGAGLPRINDGALLFLQHMISKFETPGMGGARLAIVFNGSPLFTGGAGSGESDIRKWIIENDWLEAIVALPEQMYFNTGIGTYIWVVTNRKEKRRKGKIQLVDAREFYVPMRRSLGDKRRKLGEGPSENEPDQIAEIVKAYGTAAETKAAILRDARDNGLKWITLTNGAREPVPAEGQSVEVCCISKMFDNEEFGYRRITVERPLRLRFQISTDRKSRFLDAAPHLLDDVQALDKSLGREPLLDWNDVNRLFEAVLRAEGGTWKKNELKLFREVFTESDPVAKPVARKTRPASRGRMSQESGPIYGWFTACDGRTEVLYEADIKLRDFENIPLKINEAYYFTREVQPHFPDAWIDAEKTKIGYEVNLNRQFYVYTPPRPLAAIDADLKKAEDEILRLLKEVTE